VPDEINRRLILRSRPEGPVGPQHFSLEEAPVPQIGPGEALVRVVWLGIDPTQRTWLNADRTYVDPVEVGATMRGSGVGRVVRSKTSTLTEGDWVFGSPGWQDYAVAREDDGPFGLRKVPPGIDPKAMLSVFGSNGLTAYFGMAEVGRPEPGQTVFVSGAAGGVGSVAGQWARHLGCRVIGSAGGPVKKRWVEDVALFDACIDYKTEDVAARLRDLAPDGVDVVFDNVGGEILEAALDNLAHRARIVICGGISSGYRNETYGATPRNYMQLGFKRARMEGFIFLDYLARAPEAFGQLAPLVASGSLRYEETVTDGLANAPMALQGLFDGANLGKQIVKIEDASGAL